MYQENNSVLAKLASEKVSKFKHSGRDIHIECSKQFKCNSYFYVPGQSRPFWAALKRLLNLDMIFKWANTPTIQCMGQDIRLKSERKNP